MNLLEARNLSHSFDGLLYSGLDLCLNAGESIAILGVSGSGKSTLLNNISSFLKPMEGVVLINGIDIYAQNSDKILAMRKNDIGIIFQSHYLFRGFNALENLKVASIIANKPIDSNLLKDFGIDSVLNQQIGELSGGQQQRLSIARVLTKKPTLIFADEPTGNLDSSTAKRVMRVVFNYIKTNNAALIIATHDMEIASLCDKKFVLKNQMLNRLD